MLRRFGSAFAERGGRAWAAEDDAGRIVGSVAFTLVSLDLAHCVGDSLSRNVFRNFGQIAG